MSKRSLVAIVLMLCMSLSLLVGCGGDELANEGDNSEVSSVAEDVAEDVSESEVTSETGSEEVASEEESSEAVEEVVEDYSITAIEARINEIAENYPNEDSRQIAAVVIGTNAKYMTEEEVEEALNTYEFTKEEVNELFIQYFENKGAMIKVHDQILEGSSAPMPDYASVSPIYLYCLNSEEYKECAEFEAFVLEAFENNNYIQTANECTVLWSDPEKNTIAKMLVLSTDSSMQAYYSECLPFVTE